MTSTDRTNGAITEMACIITDTNFNKIGLEFYCAVHHPENILQNASDWVKKHQPQTLDASRTSTTSLMQQKNPLTPLLTNIKTIRSFMQEIA